MGVAMQANMMPGGVNSLYQVGECGGPFAEHKKSGYYLMAGEYFQELGGIYPVGTIINERAISACAGLPFQRACGNHCCKWG